VEKGSPISEHDQRKGIYLLAIEPLSGRGVSTSILGLTELVYKTADDLKTKYSSEPTNRLFYLIEFD